jgi:esterase/lipase superfamily enzyme
MTNTRLRGSTLLLAIVLIAVGGCQARMMPTPVGFGPGAIDPFLGLTDEERTTEIEILYATDRNPTQSTKPSNAYGDRRGLSLRMGVATVRMGRPNAGWEQLADDSLSSRRPQVRLTAIEEIGKLWTTIPFSDEQFMEVFESESPEDPIRAPTRRFAALINERLARSTNQDIVLYVPGFNTPFEAPIHMMAQFAHFMGRDGVFIAYSWPARSTFLGYSKQMTTSVISERNLRQFLIFLAEETNVGRIHLVSYSAGAPIVTDALLQLRLMHVDDTLDEIRDRVRLGHVIYAGADQDLDYFRNLYLDQFDDIAETITVYTSRDDTGLVLSRLFTTGTARLGRSMGDLTANDLEALRQGTVTSFVDVTGATRAAGGGDLWAHGYWYLNSWVSMDVIALLGRDLAPVDRGLVREAGEAIWSFPSDYPQRIRAVIGAPTR